jgi:ATP-dependent helicase/nuclease subunit A
MVTTLTSQTENPQKQAANPKSSCWVGASAGTGKTKVLVDRILNLLLSEVHPESILCLTFTKAAAIEMQNRLTSKLQEWAIFEENKLAEVLHNLTGTVPSQTLLKRARSLLFDVLDTPGGMKIQTIHSFCQSLLQRFPLEAGIDPSFTLMEEDEANQLLSEAYMHALEQNDPQLLESFQKVAFRMSDYHFDDLLKSIQNQRGQFGKLLARYQDLNEYQVALEKFLNCSEPPLPLDTEALFDAVQVLSEHGTEADQEKARILQNALEDGLDYCHLFLTQEGQIRKSLASKYMYTYDTYTYNVLEAEAFRLFTTKEQEKNQKTSSLTLSFMQVVQAIFQKYQHEKHKHGLLDFEDLIAKTNELLLNPGICDWVFYKLDSKLDHILIDEAQDTSPDQWYMLTQLIQTFLTPDKPDRTLFVVGDIKQSIYSFQGAKPLLFTTLRPYFQEQVEQLQQSWQNVQLHTSFRTTAAILEVVDKVFNEYTSGVKFFDEIIHHIPYRQNEPGLVELLPLISLKEEQEENKTGWPLPIYQKKPVSAYAALAQQITLKIKLLLESSETLPSTKTHVQPGDILVLVRKRSELIPLLIQNLKQQGIAVSGTDRLPLKDHIAVMDLLALSHFLCLPLDDYSLACVLKSPMINDGKGLSEEELFDLCHNRKNSLWESLKNKSSESLVFQKAYEFLKTLLGKVDLKNPHELFHEIICNSESYFIARLGNECQDVLTEFLSQTVLFLEKNPPTLQGFMYHMETMDAEIKRSSHTGKANEVRIMTIHGAKGLQAPVIILADSTDQLTLQNENFLWHEKDSPLFILKPSKKYESATITSLKEEAFNKLEEENRRLLYVALTRPQDRLYVAGIHKKNLQSTWYHLLQSTIQPIATQTDEGGFIYQPLAFLVKTQEKSAAQNNLEIPNWILEKPVFQNFSQKTTQTISTKAMQRGIIIHKLFELLPNFKGDDLLSTVQKWIKKQGFESLLYPDDLEKVLSIITHTEYREFFGPNSLAEVAVANGEFMGRIDRLWVGSDTVVILDYKTSINPVLTISEVSQNHIQQLDEYGKAIQVIYKNHKIRTFLLWTEGPHLMEIPYQDIKNNIKGFRNE